MHDIPIERYAGAVTAPAMYGPPTLTGFHLTRRELVLLAVVALVAALFLAGGHHAGTLVLAGGFVTERERSLRTKALALHTQARAILEAGPPEGALPAEDQARYDALMDEYDQIGETVAAIERSHRAEAGLSRSLGEPTKPEAEPKAPRTNRANATPEYRRA